MKKLILVLPYFGKLPRIFPVFLKTVKSNPFVDFLIFTDNWEYGNIENVKVVCESFDKFKTRFKEKLGNTISLNTSYKLCDFKPSYGYVLQDYIKDYDYWGHCDCDLIFGNLTTLLNPLMEQDYDKIFAAGHLTLYRNTDTVNQLFIATEESRKLFEDVAKSDDIWGFDEDFFGKNNIHDIFLKSGMKIFAEDYSINPSVFSGKFVINKYCQETRSFITIPFRNEQYYWDNGHLFQVYEDNRKIVCIEKAYMHFQMRNMSVDKKVLEASKFKIVPNRFIAGKSKPNTMTDWKKERKAYFNHHKFDQLKRRIKNKIKGNVVHVRKHNHSGV